MNAYDLVGAFDMLAQLESEQTGQRKQFLQVIIHVSLCAEFRPAIVQCQQQCNIAVLCSSILVTMVHSQCQQHFVLVKELAKQIKGTVSIIVTSCLQYQGGDLHRGRSTSVCLSSVSLCAASHRFKPVKLCPVWLRPVCFNLC